ncbi:MAG: hypothetical protein KGN36_14545, partial [Acidobacteriota bacterium]|nr:hypothetical protein [Acidobacteriota bacterium]
MPEKPGQPPGAEAKPARAKKPGVRPDLATFGGLALALAGIVGGLILEKGRLQDIAQGTAALIVLGGTMGAVLVTTPLGVVRRAIRGLGGVFFERPGSPGEVMETLIGFATKARKNGIVSLETETAGIADPFL